MKARKDHSGQVELQILLGMIFSQSVLSRVASFWAKGSFQGEHREMVAGWCVDFFTERSVAPGTSIRGVYHDKAAHLSEVDAARIAELLDNNIPEQWEKVVEEMNPDYLVDLAARHFSEVRADKMLKDSGDCLKSGNLDKALSLISGFQGKVTPDRAGTDLFLDKPEVEAVFDESDSILIRYPAALGNFFCSSLERDGLVAFMAPEGTGKSWWLIDIAWNAMRQNRKVAFFEVGDMSSRQIKGRLLTRAARHPLRPTSRDGSWPCWVNVPTSISPPEPGSSSRDEEGNTPIAIVTHEKIKFAEALDKEAAWKACRRVTRKRAEPGTSYFRLSCHPADSITADQVLAIIRGWERQGWVPDVVVIDYADILAPINPREEFRHQINRTWKALRSLSLHLHCLVVTATQSDAKSYDTTKAGGVMDRRNFSEDKRKLSHASGVLGINVTLEEKKRGVCRLNWVKLREADFNPRNCVHVAGCLPLANIAVVSTF